MACERSLAGRLTQYPRFLYRNFSRALGVVPVRTTRAVGRRSDQGDPNGHQPDGTRELPPNPDIFPSDGVGVEVANRICEGCPVQERCLEYALRNRIDHGVWGGCSERQRRRILRARRLATAA